MISGWVAIMAVLLGFSLLRIALAKPLKRTRWFVENSPKLALWAAGWALALMGLSAAIKWHHPALETLAMAPILSILCSMFLLTLIEIPAISYASIIKYVRIFRGDR